MATKRHFDSLIDDSEDIHDRAAHDDLYDSADVAVQWLKDNPCPGPAIETQFGSQMKGYRTVADAVRSTFVAEESAARVARLSDLRTGSICTPVRST
jgi:hypothetical protein